jgi:hypothetical protein
MTERDLTYREPDYDDTACVHCGTALPANPRPYTWEDHGLCGLRCARLSAGPMGLFGIVARELAELAEYLGGAGFPPSDIRDWLDGVTPNGSAYLMRQHAPVEPGELLSSSPDWKWTLQSGGQVRASRVTHKPEKP